MLGMEVDDCLAFPGFEPVIARDLAIMFIDLAITLSPRIELLADSEPQRKLLRR